MSNEVFVTVLIVDVPQNADLVAMLRPFAGRAATAVDDAFDHGSARSSRRGGWWPSRARGASEMILTRAEMVMGVANLTSLMLANEEALSEMEPVVRAVVRRQPRQLMLDIARELDRADPGLMPLVAGLEGVVSRLRGIGVAGLDPEPAAFLVEPDEAESVDPLDVSGGQLTDDRILNMAVLLTDLVGAGEKPGRKLRVGDGKDIFVIGISSLRGRSRRAAEAVVAPGMESAIEGADLWRDDASAWKITLHFDRASHAKRVQQCLDFCGKHSEAIVRATQNDRSGFRELVKNIRASHDLRVGFLSSSPQLHSLATHLGLGGPAVPPFIL